MKKYLYHSLKEFKNTLIKYRIQPDLLNPIIRIFGDNHIWNTKFIPSTGRDPGYFECTCSQCGLIRRTMMIGDPFPEFILSVKHQLRRTEFKRCEDIKLNKLLK